ncbi:SpdD protein [Streptomyces sioyaensis]|uniref:SpdD protein n=1 Tax=Streptomyces sioyaensis TaxID=67364 RepID=UPI00379B096E
MFTPKYPTPDTAPPPATSPVVPLTPPAESSTPAVPVPGSSAPVPAASARPAVQLTPAGLITVAAGGTAVVLIVGTVLVSMLLAVALTGVSIAVCAVVLRLLLKDLGTHR